MKPKRKTGAAGLDLPAVIFGTSGLGNLFVALEEETKLAIVRECVRLSGGKVVFDSAGKYGAGLALEALGNCLRELKVPPGQVLISNKLGWVRTELTTKEPTFEPGVWQGLRHDAVQKISYQGILECFEQGNELLNGYYPSMVSVHDPDEYLAAAVNERQRQERYDDILQAYTALQELRKQGRVQAIGVGAKNWKTVQRIAGDVALDWIMIANSMTIKHHPPELLDFIRKMDEQGVYVINSAVFHSGFLAGGAYFDYRLVEPGTAENDALLEWRKAFVETCQYFHIRPAEACVQFALNVPGVKSIALNTTSPERVKTNMGMAEAVIPAGFWEAMLEKHLVSVDVRNWLRPAP